MLVFALFAISLTLAFSGINVTIIIGTLLHRYLPTTRIRTAVGSAATASVVLNVIGIYILFIRPMTIAAERLIEPEFGPATLFNGPVVEFLAWVQVVVGSACSTYWLFRCATGTMLGTSRLRKVVVSAFFGVHIVVTFLVAFLLIH